MVRQSITFTKPNDEWFKPQVESEEYMSKSELVKNPICHVSEQQVEVDNTHTKIERGLKNGFNNRTALEILADSLYSSL